MWRTPTYILLLLVLELFIVQVLVLVLLLLSQLGPDTGRVERARSTQRAAQVQQMWKLKQVDKIESRWVDRIHSR